MRTVVHNGAEAAIKGTTWANDDFPLQIVRNIEVF